MLGLRFVAPPLDYPIVGLPVLAGSILIAREAIGVVDLRLVGSG